jgi:hypothetical protein
MTTLENVATCKRALRTPFTVDSRAVKLSLDPFDDDAPYRHQLSMVRECLALPYDLHPEQDKAEVVTCNDCTYGFLEVDGIKSLVCAPSPYKEAHGNAQECTTCLFAPQNPSQVVDCSVCMDAVPNSANICQCIM